MILLNLTAANEPFLAQAPNPNFFGATIQQGAGGQSFWVTPPLIREIVTVQPPSIIQNGVQVDFPPYSDVVELQPPAKQVFLPGSADVVKNAYESVGIINEGGQIRLCALVRPNVIAAARHYNNPPFAPYIGLAVRFIGANGTQTAKIVKVVFTADDFECYQLDQAITVVKPAVVAPVEPDTNYVGRACTMFGLSSLVKPIAGIAPIKFSFSSGTSRTAQVSNKTNSPVQIQPGDSGSPCFIIVDGLPRYFGSLAAVNLTVTQINVASPWIPQINAL
jgi:hypothetical protein